MTTLKEVVDYASTSMADAYHVLTGATDIDDDVRAAVLDAASVLQYKLNITIRVGRPMLTCPCDGAGGKALYRIGRTGDRHRCGTHGL